jgi:hypothetical protein
MESIPAAADDREGKRLLNGLFVGGSSFREAPVLRGLFKYVAFVFSGDGSAMRPMVRT